ncbi:hypothetical protein O7607_17910 [Micromonospora sp. WMMA1949]|uniref:hypothetical protein n=1 Tax=Micromonospora sp. WMMA1949 TaxID=3015162 RepID=UPI0022B60637|nr:hypothetical protein [Micromonospora sp. WMMA1949]MCZ7427615.1 hypothetical protein [Micromonospora sp. WMMA1949]
MTDLDQRITSVLREHAEGAVDIDRLTARAVTGGRRRLRRRRSVLGGGLALVALLGGLAVVPGLPGVDRPFTGPAVGSGPVPPVMRAEPGAAAAPEVVGTDTGVLHFGVDTSRARYLRWETWRDVESIRLDVGGGRIVTVELARSAESLRQYTAEGVPFDVSVFAEEAAFDGSTSGLTVDGLTIRVRQWKPVPGLYARASTSGQPDTALTTAVEALRLNEARRCGAPVRPTSLPDGARVVGCRVDVSGFPRLVTARFVITGPVTQEMAVSYRYAAEASTSTAGANMEINGRPARLYAAYGRIELLGLPKAHLLAEYGWPHNGFDERDAALVLGGVQVAPDPTRPETWD